MIGVLIIFLLSSQHFFFFSLIKKSFIILSFGLVLSLFMAQRKDKLFNKEKKRKKGELVSSHFLSFIFFQVLAGQGIMSQHF